MTAADKKPVEYIPDDSFSDYFAREAVEDIENGEYDFFGRNLEYETEGFPAVIDAVKIDTSQTIAYIMELSADVPSTLEMERDFRLESTMANGKYRDIEERTEHEKVKDWDFTVWDIRKPLQDVMTEKPVSGNIYVGEDAEIERIEEFSEAILGDEDFWREYKSINL